MNIADPLSRLCIISDCEKTNDDEHVNQIVENAKPCAISLTEIKMHSEQDSEILELPIPPAPMKRRELLDAPWVDIAMDLLGPLPSNDYLLVVVDYYSRHKEVKITKTITSCNNQAIERNIWQPSAYWPQQNGEVERQNKSIEKKDLQDSLNDFLKMYNSTPHSVTGKTPTKLFYKRQNLEAKIKNKKRVEGEWISMQDN
ncbi:unnamed protein product [Leptosia nina]|uniref:Integrase catalytic domain-containing protein n=1 Tax=Leptosia nina TaxID=320188 RepID=A0AAV1JIW8_9NEOP